MDKNSIKTTNNKPKLMDKDVTDDIISNNDIISVEDLTFSYLRNKEILQGITFNVKKGEKIVFLGENGSGKSTLFLCLLNLIPKFGGSIRYNCENRKITLDKKSAIEIRKRVGMLFQDSNDQLFLPMVKEEIAFGLYNLGYNGKELEEKIKNTVKDLQLEDYIDKKTFHLSHGEKKKIAFAGIYGMDPEIYLLDEPFASLDPKSRIGFYELLKDLDKKDKTILLISHELEFIPEFFNRVIVLDEGKIIYDGSMRELYKSPEILKKANLRVPIISKLIQELIKSGVIPENKKIPINLKESISFFKDLLK